VLLIPEQDSNNSGYGQSTQYDGFEPSEGSSGSKKSSYEQSNEDETPTFTKDQSGYGGANDKTTSDSNSSKKESFFGSGRGGDDGEEQSYGSSSGRAGDQEDEGSYSQKQPSYVSSGRGEEDSSYSGRTNDSETKSDDY